MNRNSHSISQIRRPFSTSAKAVRGFTLIELMVTLAVLGLLAALATPSFTSIINNNRLAGLSNDVIAMLQTARMEATRRGKRVVVCPSNDGAACTTGDRWNGWVVFEDEDGDAVIDAGNDEILRSEVLREPLQLWTSDNLNDQSRIVFRHDGFAYEKNGTSLLAANITVCIPTDRPEENVRDVSIVTGTRISSARRDANGICGEPNDP